MIQNAVAELVRYGYATGLLEAEDRIWAANALIRELGLDDLTEEAEARIFEGNLTAGEARKKLPAILDTLCGYAAEKGMIADNTVTYRDLFDTKLM